jgi:hypothetical protein
LRILKSLQQGGCDVYPSIAGSFSSHAEAEKNLPGMDGDGKICKELFLVKG